MYKFWTKDLSFLFSIIFFLSGVCEAPNLLASDLLALCTSIDYNDYNDIQIENIMYKRMFCTNFNFPKYCVGVLYSKAGSNQACKKCQW